MPGDLRDNTQATDDPMAQPVLCVFSKLPWVLLPRESWCWVIPRHSMVWLYLFPYKRLRCSTSEISKGNVLCYFRNLGFLRYGTSTAFLAVLWAAHLSRFLRRNLRCGGEVAAYIARCPSFWRAMVGCIAIGSRTAYEPLVRSHLFEPMDVQLHCMIKKGFSWREKSEFSHTCVFDAVLVPYLREPRLRQ